MFRIQNSIIFFVLLIPAVSSGDPLLSKCGEYVLSGEILREDGATHLVLFQGSQNKTVLELSVEGQILAQPYVNKYVEAQGTLVNPLKFFRGFFDLKVIQLGIADPLASALKQVRLLKPRTCGAGS